MQLMCKLTHSILGFVVGDALGVPVEFKERDSYQITGMVAHEELGLPAGTWSDDSSMTLATMQSIVKNKSLDWADLMYKFQAWRDEGEFTPHGECFDIGITTDFAIDQFCDGCEPLDCGGADLRSNGNGSLMRILPLAFFPHSAQDRDNLSRLTHAHERSLRACELYIQLAHHLLQGGSTLSYLKRLEDEPYPYKRLAHLRDLQRHEIKSTGYVVDTLEAALWSILQTSNYRDCVLLAVNLGEDTDTIAAIAGGLAGIIYGRGGELGIPEEWVQTLAKKDWILQLCKQFKLVCEES